MVGRLREIIDWKFILATAFLMLVVQMGFNSWSDAKTNESLVTQLEAEQARSAVDRKQASEERTRLVEGQRQLRRDYQLLLDYLEDEGVTIPPDLARSITLGGGSGRNDDDDDTNITVRPETRTTTPAPSGSSSGGSSSPTPDEGEPNLTDVVPDLPLPGPVGEATDTAKRIVDDLPEMLPIQ